MAAQLAVGRKPLLAPYVALMIPVLDLLLYIPLGAPHDIVCIQY